MLSALKETTKVEAQLEGIDQRLRDILHAERLPSIAEHSAEEGTSFPNIKDVGDGLLEIDSRISEAEAGRRAAQLYEEGLTYGEIALQLCSERKNHSHHCGKICARRIRHAAKPYLSSMTKNPHRPDIEGV